MPNVFDQFDEPASLKFANLDGNLKLDPLQQVQMQSGMADPENAGATLSNLLRGNDDVFLQTVAPPITAAAHALLDNPVTRKVGYGLNFAGQAVKGDVEAALFQMLGYPELANQQLIATAENMNPAWKQKDESLGIDTSDPYEDARQTLPVAQRMISGIGPDLLQSVPQMVLAALQPELGAASFGFTPQGFDPVQAAAAMVAPGGGKMIGSIAEGLAAKAGVSNEQALNVINRVGGGAGVTGLMSAPTAYQIAQMDPGKERDQAIQDATSNAIFTGILGGFAGRGHLSGKPESEAMTQNPIPGSFGSLGTIFGQESVANVSADNATQTMWSAAPAEARPFADDVLKQQSHSNELNAGTRPELNALQDVARRTKLAREVRIAKDNESTTPGTQNLTMSIGDLRAAGMKDAHHVIQNAAVKQLPGYNSNRAPGVQLPGPARVKGTRHNIATSVQRQAGGGTYAAERRIGYKALRLAGYFEQDVRQILKETDAYFKSIGVGPSTQTRIPANRR